MTDLIYDYQINFFRSLNSSFNSGFRSSAEYVLSLFLLEIFLGNV